MPRHRIIEAEQGVKKEAERNGFIVAIEARNRSHPHVKRLQNLGKQFLYEVEKFFVNYHELSGEKFRVLAGKGPLAAQRAIQRASKAHS